MQESRGRRWLRCLVYLHRQAMHFHETGIAEPD